MGMGVVEEEHTLSGLLLLHPLSPSSCLKHKEDTRVEMGATIGLQ